MMLLGSMLLSFSGSNYMKMKNEDSDRNILAVHYNVHHKFCVVDNSLFCLRFLNVFYSGFSLLHAHAIYRDFFSCKN